MVVQAANAYQDRADRFLRVVNAGFQSLSYVAQEALWEASTDVKPEHDAAAAAAGKAFAAFNGSPALIQEARALLKHSRELTPVTVAQLEWVLFNAAEGPMTDPRLTAERIEQETRQASAMNGYVWKLEGKPVTANQIDGILDKSRDLAERRKIWELSKEGGASLKAGLLRLRDLRNGCARELGYPDYFSLQAAKHGLTGEEMIQLNRDFLKVLRPLYLQLHTWAKYELARRYGQPVPERIPAHWINNRWSQQWTDLVEGVDFNPYFKGWTSEQVVKSAEAFYVGLGFPSLPTRFWEQSDLYPVKPGETRKKNSHASCWHLDLDRDIRSLMSVEPDFKWFETVHHELGHGYYFMSYSHPGIPPLLRTSASPALHEGMAELMSMATRQIPYLKAAGVLLQAYQADPMKILLNEALEIAVPFMFWSSGTMAEWEWDFYGQNLPADRLNARWWQLVRDIQGVEPPVPRGEAFCDAATKTHINDAPCYYVNYPIATVFKFQMHDHIARKILHQDPHACNYGESKEVGRFLRAWLEKGATEDWRTLLRDATGEDLSTRAMAAYFQPLLAWLQKENQGRRIGWE